MAREQLFQARDDRLLGSDHDASPRQCSAHPASSRRAALPGAGDAFTGDDATYSHAAARGSSNDTRDEGTRVGQEEVQPLRHCPPQGATIRDLQQEPEAQAGMCDTTNQSGKDDSLIPNVCIFQYR